MAARNALIGASDFGVWTRSEGIDEDNEEISETKHEGSVKSLGREKLGRDVALSESLGFRENAHSGQQLEHSK